MLSWQPQPTTWHTGPETWASSVMYSRLTSNQVTARTAASVAAGMTQRTTSRTDSTEFGATTGSTFTQVFTNSNTGGGGGSGSSSGSTQLTYNNTSSSMTGDGGSASSSFTSAIFVTTTGTSNVALDLYWTRSTSSSLSVIVTWPSTYAATVSTLDGGDTTTTTSKSAGTFVTENSTSTVPRITAPTTYTEYSSIDTKLITESTTAGPGGTTTSNRTTSTVSHHFLRLLDTAIIADANPGAAAGTLYNDCIVWGISSNMSSASTIALFSNIFTTMGAGTSPFTVKHYTNIRSGSTAWISYALSTSSTTATSTESISTSTATTGTTTSATTSSSQTANTTLHSSSLDGNLWNPDEAPSSATIYFGSITGTSMTTYEAGTDTITETFFTFTSQVTGYSTENSQWTTTVTTVSHYGLMSMLITWNTWDRSFTDSSETFYPSFTTTNVLMEAFSTNGWKLGSVSVTSQVSQELLTTVTYTSWDNKTAFWLNGVYSTTDSNTAGGGAATAHTSARTLEVNWTRIDHENRSFAPFATGAENWEFSRYARVWQGMWPRGYLGFGSGFGEDAEVYANVSTSLIEGLADPFFSLVASQLPKYIFRPDASVFVTDKCWLKGHPISSGMSMGWLGTDSGSRLSASLSHEWISQETTTTSTQSETGSTSTSTTTGTRYTATYGVAVHGPISGTFYSEYEPWLNSFQSEIGKPWSPDPEFFNGGGPFGGIAPQSNVLQTATFRAGAVTCSWASSGTDTASSSTSTSSGELVIELQSSQLPVAFSFEPALRLLWSEGSFAQLLTASRYYLPPYDWDSDLQ